MISYFSIKHYFSKQGVLVEMTIDCMEHGTKVKIPYGHTGRLKITRRERKLVDKDASTLVDVIGTDGLIRSFEYREISEVEKGKDPFVTVAQGMRGYFAVLMTWNEDCNGFPEPYNTGETCKDHADAVAWAKDWAKSKGIEYHP